MIVIPFSFKYEFRPTERLKYKGSKSNPYKKQDGYLRPYKKYISEHPLYNVPRIPRRRRRKIKNKRSTYIYKYRNGNRYKPISIFAIRKYRSYYDSYIFKFYKFDLQRITPSVHTTKYISRYASELVLRRKFLYTHIKDIDKQKLFKKIISYFPNNGHLNMVTHIYKEKEFFIDSIIFRDGITEYKCNNKDVTCFINENNIDLSKTNEIPDQYKTLFKLVYY